MVLLQTIPKSDIHTRVDSKIFERNRTLFWNVLTISKSSLRLTTRWSLAMEGCRQTRNWLISSGSFKGIKSTYPILSRPFSVHWTRFLSYKRHCPQRCSLLDISRNDILLLLELLGFLLLRIQLRLYIHLGCDTVSRDGYYYKKVTICAFHTRKTPPFKSLLCFRPACKLTRMPLDPLLWNGFIEKKTPPWWFCASHYIISLTLAFTGVLLGKMYSNQAVFGFSET